MSSSDSQNPSSSPPSKDSSPSSSPAPNNNNNYYKTQNENNNYHKAQNENNNNNENENNNNNENENENNNKNDGNNNKNNDNNSESNNNNGDKSLSAAPRQTPSSSHSALSPPKKASSSSNKPSNSSYYSTDNIIITGAAIGATLLLLLMILCVVCCCKRKKKKQRHDESYYGNKPDGIKDYHIPQQHAWKQNQQPNDVHLKMPPEPPSGPTSSEKGWVAVPPPPPPAMMSSGEMSSSSYSGPYQAPVQPPHPGGTLGFNKGSFTYHDLATATRGFNQSLLLGQGGFGYVHKGVLPNGNEVAVKSLKDGSGQGDREFEAEVEIISRVHHRHLVSLVGYCITGQQRMLVYEFIPNKTLEYHLHGHDHSVMDCSTRLQIALGSAKGFAYLHEDCNPRIIHRDIKAANILIDNNYEAKVADFGLAKLSSDTITHVSTRIMGTFGYLAPEYASTGKLTEKSDVYSYGVVLLELITGRRPIVMHSDEDSLIDWARPILMQASDGGSFEDMVDPGLKNNYDQDKMHRMVACAAACIRHSARRRPKMSQIVRVLEGDVSLDNLNDVGKNTQNTIYSFGGRNLDYDSHSYNGDNKRYMNGSLSSQEFSSSEPSTTDGSQELHPKTHKP